MLQKGTKEARQRRKLRIRSTLIGEGVLIAFVVIGMNNGFLFNYIKGNGWNYTQEIEEHGYMPYFFSNIMATANGYHTDSAACGSVAVGADKGLAGSTEALEVYLVADTVAGT